MHWVCRLYAGTVVCMKRDDASASNTNERGGVLSHHSLTLSLAGVVAFAALSNESLGLDPVEIGWRFLLHPDNVTEGCILCTTLLSSQPLLACTNGG